MLIVIRWNKYITHECFCLFLDNLLVTKKHEGASPSDVLHFRKVNSKQLMQIGKWHMPMRRNNHGVIIVCTELCPLLYTELTQLHQKARSVCSIPTTMHSYTWLLCIRTRSTRLTYNLLWDRIFITSLILNVG